MLKADDVRDVVFQLAATSSRGTLVKGIAGRTGKEGVDFVGDCGDGGQLTRYATVESKWNYVPFVRCLLSKAKVY